jgi:hypothetical protein
MGILGPYASFENSMHVDEAYMKVQQVNMADDWNYVHTT